MVVEVQDLDGNALIGPLTLHEGFTGSGTAEDTFVIHSWEQVELIGEAPDAHYLLAADLDLKGIPRQQIGTEWVLQDDANGTTRGPGAFMGTFDGGGHTISGLRADAAAGGGRYALWRRACSRQPEGRGVDGGAEHDPEVLCRHPRVGFCRHLGVERLV